MSGDQGSANSNNDDGFTTVGGGLIVRFPGEYITPFVHAIGQAGLWWTVHTHQPYTWGPGLTVGGGLDYETPWFNHRLAIRLFQADYEYMHVNFGPRYLWRPRQHQRGAVERAVL